MAELDVYEVEVNGYITTVQLSPEDAKKRDLKASDKASSKAAARAAAVLEREEQDLARTEAAQKAGKAPANKAAAAPVNKGA